MNLVFPIEGELRTLLFLRMAVVHFWGTLVFAFSIILPKDGILLGFLKKLVMVGFPMSFAHCWRSLGPHCP